MASALPIVQLIAYVMLTLASVVVASVSALFAYRNNFGWKPLVLVVGQGLIYYGGSLQAGATVTFEIWNRRKYPISVRSVSVRFDDSIILRDTVALPPWIKTANTLTNDMLINRTALTIAPAMHERMHLEVALEAEGDQARKVAGRIAISVGYFDPRYPEGRTLAASHQFGIP
jgi:hypothetical protein